MTLQIIKRSIRELSLDQLRRLELWIHELIEKTETNRIEENRKNQETKLEERQIENKTYRLESVRCGKATCKCSSGSLHGPYWYAYWSENGKTRSQYIGRKPPKKLRTSST